MRVVAEPGVVGAKKSWDKVAKIIGRQVCTRTRGEGRIVIYHITLLAIT